MKKTYIVGFALTILVLAMVLSLAGCIGQGDDDMNETGNEDESEGQYSEHFNKASDNSQDVKPLPNNYRITKKLFAGDSGNNFTATVREMRFEEGFVIMTESSGNFSDNNSIAFYDFKNDKAYLLDPIKKTGLIMSGNGEKNIESNFNVVTKDYNDMKNVGHEKVAGRNAIVYEAEVSIQIDGQKAEGKTKVWIDEEYGILLKQQQIGQAEGKEAVTMSEEITEFTIGGCKLTDIVNLSEYTLTDMSSFS
jgi:hypothetical protein